jgi:hypothetical protein
MFASLLTRHVVRTSQQGSVQQQISCFNLVRSLATIKNTASTLTAKRKAKRKKMDVDDMLSSNLIVTASSLISEPDPLPSAKPSPPPSPVSPVSPSTVDGSQVETDMQEMAAIRADSYPKWFSVWHNRLLPMQNAPQCASTSNATNSQHQKPSSKLSHTNLNAWAKPQPWDDIVNAANSNVFVQKRRRWHDT